MAEDDEKYNSEDDELDSEDDFGESSEEENNINLSNTQNLPKKKKYPAGVIKYFISKN